MKHINDIDLMEYVAGKLSAAGNKQVQEHIAACNECSDRWRKAVELWNTLGQWKLDTAGHDLTRKITAIAEQEQRRHKRFRKARHLRIGFLPAVLRVAASIIIAVGVGHKLGKYSVTGNVPSAEALQKRPQYLAALSLQWSSELAWFILEDQAPNVGEQR
jgi:anti-sigma factor RsiW